jgi:large subunit ribosomal protein L13
MNNTYLSYSNCRQKKWYLIEVNQKPLGRVATQIAYYLIGKHKIDYHPSLDLGDYVIVTNVENIRVTGLKEKSKTYFSHSGRPGGATIETLKSLRNRLPERILEKAVKGMLPKGPLGRSMFKRLKIYKGFNHPHKAQNPELLNF